MTTATLAGKTKESVIQEGETKQVSFNREEKKENVESCFKRILVSEGKKKKKGTKKDKIRKSVKVTQIHPKNKTLDIRWPKMKNETRKKAHLGGIVEDDFTTLRS